MGVFSRSKHSEPPAVVDTANAPGSSDVEKQYVAHLESHGEDAVQRHIDAETEKRLVRKLDRRLVPLVMVLYLLAYLDRSNIG